MSAPPVLDERVWVGLLGPVEVRTAEGPVALAGAKQRVLLACLAIARGRPVPVSRLVDALWPEELPVDASHALHAHVSRLRGAVPVAVHRTPGGYRMDTEGYQLDLVRFEELCERGRRRLADQEPDEAVLDLSEALALWRGEPCEGLGEVAALRAYAVRLTETCRSARLDRLDAEVARGRAQEVIGELQQLVTDDPLQERGWYLLLLALSRLGRESEALEVYQRARATFVDQLGADPGDRLVALHQAILRRTVGPAGTRVVDPDTDPAEPAGLLVPGRAAERDAEPPAPGGLTGRARELALVEQGWRRAQRGVHVVTVSGDPGIGKSRLVHEVAERHRAAGARVLRGWCDPAWSAPYHPVVEMLRAELAGTPLSATGAEDGTARLPPALGPHPEELARLLPELADRIPPGELSAITTGSGLHRTFDAVAGWLEHAGRDGPLVLVVEDLHWADPHTLTLLQHLSRTPRRLRLLVLLTVRDQDLAEQDKQHTPLGWLMRQSDGLTHLPLSGLDEESVAALLAAEVADAGGTDGQAGALRESVIAAAGGNPLFVVELARHAALTGVDAVSGSGAGLPAGVREVVKHRWQRLSAPVRELLVPAAVIGRELDPQVLQRVAGVDESALDALLAEATQHRLVTRVSGPRVRYAFSHDVVRAVLRESIPPLRRAALHGRVADVFLGGEVDDPPVAELAHHCAEAAAVGDTATAVHYLDRAAAIAMQRRSPALAASHWGRALSLLGPGDHDGLRCDLLTRCGTAEFHAGEPAYRATLLEACRRAWDRGDSVRLRAAAGANNRGWWSSTTEVDRERVTFLERALTTDPPAEPGERARLLALWSLEVVRDPGCREAALAGSAESLRIAERLGEETLLAHALSHRYAVLFAAFADPVGCYELSVRLQRLADHRGDPELRLSALVGLAQSAMVLGEFAVADEAVRQGLRLGELLDQPSRSWLLRGWEAMLSATRGDLTAAEQQATAACDLGARTAQPDALTWFSGQLFTLRLLGGRLPEIIDEIDAQVTAVPAGIPAWRAARAYALVEAGRAEEAAAELGTLTGGGGVALPRDMLWLPGVAYLSHVAVGLQDTAAGAVLYAALAPSAGLVAHNGTIDAGPVDLWLGRLARLTGDEGAADAYLAAADDQCQRIRAPLWQQRVRAARAAS